MFEIISINCLIIASIFIIIMYQIIKIFIFCVHFDRISSHLNKIIIQPIKTKQLTFKQYGSTQAKDKIQFCLNTVNKINFYTHFFFYKLYKMHLFKTQLEITIYSFTCSKTFFLPHVSNICNEFVVITKFSENPQKFVL